MSTGQIILFAVLGIIALAIIITAIKAAVTNMSALP